LEEIHLNEVLPFRAWRYSPDSGDLDRLVAPPYDVVGPELQSALYERSPYNVIRLDLGLSEPDDDDTENKYTRAARLLEEWKVSGALMRDARPTVTFVEESFTGPDGTEGRRHGLLAVLRLSEFGEGVVFPHEHTLTGPKEDRFRLMSATAMSLSPIFMLYDVPSDDLTNAWGVSLAAKEPTSAVVDDLGNTTRLWPTSDPLLLDLVSEKLAGSRFLVADGHHRYETALRYQKTQRETLSARNPAEAITSAPQAADYCLVYLANMSDPALAIYPTHRLLHDLPDEAVLGLPKALAQSFDVERLVETGSGFTGAARGAVAHEAIAAYLAGHPRGAFGLWGPHLEAAYGVCLPDLAEARVSTEHSDAYQELDVVILQALVLQKTLGISPADIAASKHVTYFKDTSEALTRLQAGEFQVGFFMNATGLDQVCEVAFGGERMPQKTTFFYPKLPTGLLFHDLTGELLS